MAGEGEIEGGEEGRHVQRRGEGQGKLLRVFGPSNMGMDFRLLAVCGECIYPLSHLVSPGVQPFLCLWISSYFSSIY